MSYPWWAEGIVFSEGRCTAMIRLCVCYCNANHHGELWLVIAVLFRGRLIWCFITLSIWGDLQMQAVWSLLHDFTWSNLPSWAVKPMTVSWKPRSGSLGVSSTPSAQAGSKTGLIERLMQEKTECWGLQWLNRVKENPNRPWKED